MVERNIGIDRIMNHVLLYVFSFIHIYLHIIYIYVIEYLKDTYVSCDDMYTYIYIYIYGQRPHQDLPISFFNGIYALKMPRYCRPLSVCCLFDPHQAEKSKTGDDSLHVLQGRVHLFQRSSPVYNPPVFHF